MNDEEARAAVGVSACALRKWFESNGKNSKAVIGISGGKDSTVVAALCVEALGADRVLGVLMPNGEQSDIEDSRTVCRELKIAHVEVNIKGAFDALFAQTEALRGIPILKDDLDPNGQHEQARINLSPRLRMSTLYMISQAIGGRVMNTSNYSEYMVGYFTRFGDECGDYKPLIKYTKTQVVAMGLILCEYKGLSPRLILKEPSDGLSGLSDEDKFGFTYKELDAALTGNFADVGEASLGKISARVRETQFKREGAQR